MMGAQETLLIVMAGLNAVTSAWSVSRKKFGLAVFCGIIAIGCYIRSIAP